jgi:hypothetical protein
MAFAQSGSLLQRQLTLPRSFGKRQKSGAFLFQLTIDYFSNWKQN